MTGSLLIHRRKFLSVSAGGMAVTALLPSCSTPPRWRFLTETQAEVLEAVADQVIPPDQDPGGKWAGVVRFIDRQLMGPYERYQVTYDDGIRSLDRTARELKGAYFTELSPQDQLMVLESLEGSAVPDGIWTLQSPGEFFGLVIEHCMQGFYGNPRHGGNRDYCSYRMIGVDYPQIIGRTKV